MDTVELTRFALGNAFDILDQVVSDVTPEQAEWMPPGIANPIGGLYWHTITGADEVVHRWILGQAPLHEREGWANRALAVAVPEPQDPDRYHEYFQELRVRLPALHGYAHALAGTLQGWLATLTPADLERTIETPIGPYNLAHVLEVFIIWHINAHCGEISALKGCQGARGYPF